MHTEVAMDRKPAERLAELIETLKPLPHVATLLIEKCNDPNTGMREVGDILKNDPAFTVKVLTVSNSVFYRGTREIKTARDAVQRIGLKALKHVIYSTAVYNLFSKTDRQTGFDREGFWLHSVSVAVCAKVLARRFQLAEDEAFTAGLLHDIGKIIIDQAATERFGTSKSTKLESVIVTDTESLIDGFDPAEVGYRAARKWNLPGSIQKALAYVRIEDLDFIENSDEQMLVRVIQSSNAFCEDLASLRNNPHAEFLEAYASRFGMTMDDIVAFVEAGRKEVSDIAGLFELKDIEVHRYFDALAVAQKEVEKADLETRR
jgi:HD-like signal output (HDOD) protein